jgi:hypothetical protein
LRNALGFPKPAPLLRKAVEGGLKLRAKIVACLPERRKSMLYSKIKRRTYLYGYQIPLLGTFPNTSSVSTATSTTAAGSSCAVHIAE